MRNFKRNNVMKTTKKHWKSIIRDLFCEKIPEKAVICNVDNGAEVLESLRVLSCLPRPSIVIFPLLSDAESALDLFSCWAELAEEKIDFVLLPEIMLGEKFIPESEAERARAVYRAMDDDSSVFIASASGVFSPVPDPDGVASSSFTLSIGDSIKFSDLFSAIVDMDYDDEYEARMAGEFSRRGGILDIFSPAYDYPARVEFFGDTIESIRLFSPKTQRTFKAIADYTVIPRRTIGEVSSDSTFLDCFRRTKPSVVIISPEKSREHVNMFNDSKALASWDTFIEEDNFPKVMLLDSADSSTMEGAEKIDCGIRRSSELIQGDNIPAEVDSMYSEWHRQLTAERIKQWIFSGYQVVITGSLDSSYEHINKWCQENGVDTQKVSIENHLLPYGITIPGKKLAVITEKEVFASTRHHTIPSIGLAKKSIIEKNIPGDALEGESLQLDPGDHAVHLNHGICLYRGIEEIRDKGRTQEMFKLEFDDDLILYVPVRNANLLSRYIGAKRDCPKLSKLGGKKWLGAKLSAARDIRNMATDLIGVQALRMQNRGYAFAQDDLWQHIFEEAFPFTETPDQLKAVAEIKHDMALSRPMDRLLCGDVGYGKTEVAMRAAFKAVMEGKQVAILVPTTILAQQHYYTFRDRFVEHPVIIETLSRFRSNREQRETIKLLKEGKVDIIIGTHRLVQKDVQFSNLGLVIIDEEQRFGVGHKERLKQFRATVDVLTMTATPIPRTLYMSMTGLRDLSTIMTPPGKRLPIRTFISRQEDKIAIEAIQHEVQRGGQVYYLHNRVNSIHRRCSELSSMVPNAKFAVAHGRMEENELESVMGEFLDGKTDVLICTTIIESGLDIPNANTIIIERADRFGLSDLYQLRGRVGRWHRQAYAYFFLPRDSIITGNARKRIAAIKRYTELGSGFRLALRDLEIRGAGNILGAKQSGHINTIGFDLYCQLLRSAVAEQRDGTPTILPQVDLDIDFLDFSSSYSKGHLSASLPESYIPSERNRVTLYKRLANAMEMSEIDDIKAELKDKFGPYPEVTENFLSFSCLRLNLARSGYTSLRVKDKKIYIESGHSIWKLNGKVPELKQQKPKDKFKELMALMERAGRKSI
jgi:transcription-repair coupling factor (superfamily II helicase)